MSISWPERHFSTCRRKRCSFSIAAFFSSSAPCRSRSSNSRVRQLCDSSRIRASTSCFSAVSLSYFSAHSTRCAVRSSSFFARKSCDLSCASCSSRFVRSSSVASFARATSFCPSILASPCSCAFSFFSSVFSSILDSALFFCSSSFNVRSSCMVNFTSLSYSAYSCASSCSSDFTASETSFSRRFTSKSSSWSFRSSSAFETRPAKPCSPTGFCSSFFASSSSVCIRARSCSIFTKFPCAFGFSFRFRHSAWLDSRNAAETSTIFCCTFWNSPLFISPFRVPRLWIKASYCFSSSRCSLMIREISSPMNWVSSSRSPPPRLERKLSFFTALSIRICARSASTGFSLFIFDWDKSLCCWTRNQMEHCRYYSASG
mmetsp:Transcript_6798/g.16623  ORF Transcript_6798/g.16623 Transcript_6798/m.16623 type:complete len:374 (+) Transcript_6798:386-1507(+)